MQELRDYRVRFAIDDFGMEYSSLSYLSAYRWILLKIVILIIRD